jgi:hypothetical protein
LRISAAVRRAASSGVRSLFTRSASIFFHGTCAAQQDRKHEHIAMMWWSAANRCESVHTPLTNPRQGSLQGSCCGTMLHMHREGASAIHVQLPAASMPTTLSATMYSAAWGQALRCLLPEHQRLTFLNFLFAPLNSCGCTSLCFNTRHDSFCGTEAQQHRVSS